MPAVCGNPRRRKSICQTGSLRIIVDAVPRLWWTRRSLTADKRCSRHDLADWIAKSIQIWLWQQADTRILWCGIERDRGVWCHFLPLTAQQNIMIVSHLNLDNPVNPKTVASTFFLFFFFLLITQKQKFYFWQIKRPFHAKSEITQEKKVQHSHSHYKCDV